MKRGHAAVVAVLACGCGGTLAPITDGGPVDSGPIVDSGMHPTLPEASLRDVGPPPPPPLSPLVGIYQCTTTDTVMFIKPPMAPQTTMGMSPLTIQRQGGVLVAILGSVDSGTACTIDLVPSGDSATVQTSPPQDCSQSQPGITLDITVATFTGTANGDLTVTLAVTVTETGPPALYATEQATGTCTRQ